MPAPIPRRKPDRSKSPFAPILASRANNNRVILHSLAKYLEGLNAASATTIRVRRFLTECNALTKIAPRSTSLHATTTGRNTIVWAHEPTLAPTMEVMIVVPTSATFLSMRKDMT
jgi:hypothetical protein